MIQIHALLVLQTLTPRVVYVVRKERSIKTDNAKINVMRVIKIMLELVNVVVISTVLITLTTWVVFVVRRDRSIKADTNKVDNAKKNAIQVGIIILEFVNVGS